MELGEAVVVVFRTSVYEAEVMEGWTEEEVEAYHDADPEARAEFKSRAIELAFHSVNPYATDDIDVILDGMEMA